MKVNHNALKVVDISGVSPTSSRPPIDQLIDAIVQLSAVKA